MQLLVLTVRSDFVAPGAVKGPLRPAGAYYNPSRSPIGQSRWTDGSHLLSPGTATCLRLIIPEWLTALASIHANLLPVLGIDECLNKPCKAVAGCAMGPSVLWLLGFFLGIRHHRRRGALALRVPWGTVASPSIRLFPDGEPFSASAVPISDRATATSRSYSRQHENSLAMLALALVICSEPDMNTVSFTCHAHSVWAARSSAKLCRG